MRRNQTGLRAYMESTDKHMARWEAYLEKGLAKDELQAKDELRARDELHGNVINRQVSKPRNTHRNRESKDKRIARWETYLEKAHAKYELLVKDELHGDVIDRQVSNI